MQPVIHVVQHLQPGGIESLVLAIAAKDPACRIISLEGTYAEAVAHWPRIAAAEDRVFFLGKPPGLSLRTVWRLARLLRNLNARVVHTHHVGPLLYGGLAARLAGIKSLAHTEHDAWHLEAPRRARLVSAAFWLLRPNLISDAEAVARNVQTFTGFTSTIVRNGIDMDRFRPGSKDAARAALGLPASRPIIGTAGRLEPVKNQSLLLEAVAQTPELSDVTVAIAGQGTKHQHLLAKASALGLQDRVHLLGQVEDVPLFMSALDLFALPSLNEGYPLSLIEAQACGVPVVATDVGGVREAVCPSTGRLVPSNDSTFLAAAFSAALHDSRGECPRQFAEVHGSLDAMIARHADVYGRASE